MHIHVALRFDERGDDKRERFDRKMMEIMSESMCPIFWGEIPDEDAFEIFQGEKC